MTTIQKSITFFGQNTILMCDRMCDKAWGINSRPNAIEDHSWAADNELGDAPEDPGTYEGGHAKPKFGEAKLNKWCARECERSVIVALPDFSKRIDL